MTKKERDPKVTAELKKSEEFYRQKGVSIKLARSIPLMSVCLIEKGLDVPQQDIVSPGTLFAHFKVALATALDELGETHKAETLQACSSLEELAPILAKEFDVRQPQLIFQRFCNVCNCKT